MTKISTMLEADPQQLEGLESNIQGFRVEGYGFKVGVCRNPTR